MYVTCESKCIFEQDENEPRRMHIYGIDVWSNVFESQIYDIWESKVIHSHESEAKHLFIICESKRNHMRVTCESKCISISNTKYACCQKYCLTICKLQGIREEIIKRNCNFFFKSKGMHVYFICACHNMQVKRNAHVFCSQT